MRLAGLQGPCERWMSDQVRHDESVGGGATHAAEPGALAGAVPGSVGVCDGVSPWAFVRFVPPSAAGPGALGRVPDRLDASLAPGGAGGASFWAGGSGKGVPLPAPMYRGQAGAFRPTDSSCTDKPMPCATLRSYGQSACRMHRLVAPRTPDLAFRCSDAGNQTGNVPKGISRPVDIGAKWRVAAGCGCAGCRGKVLRDFA